jgi:lysophospholipase L1-like esterase
MKSIKPIQILIYLIIVLFFLGLISLVFTYIFPEGIKISENTTIRFSNIHDLFDKNNVKYADIENIIDRKLDSTQLKELNSLEDSLAAFKKISFENPARFHFPDGKENVLHDFFDALEKVEDNNSSLRILHYGDSQIEMDRITGYVREQLQQRFGGYGPGLQPAIQIIPSTCIRQSSTGNWKRYASWGFGDSIRANHRRYGVMLNVSEFSGEAGIVFNQSHMAEKRAKLIKKVSVLLGNNESEVTVGLYVNGKKLETKKIEPTQGMTKIDWSVDTIPKSISLQFYSASTTEVYGISLDGKKGVAVDNLPMRGCSGTIFTKGDENLLKRSFEMLDVNLLILQFGGNMMPSINGPKNAVTYGESFYKQIEFLKKLKPDMDIIVIGPADMSKKIDGSMQSYPYIKNVIEALKKATHDAGGVYWNMYEVMGGNNSMPSWVNKGLAGKDYIHFTTKGAQKISELFYEALINEYNLYRLKKRIDVINNSASKGK